MTATISQPPTTSAGTSPPATARTDVTSAPGKNKTKQKTTIILLVVVSLFSAAIAGYMYWRSLEAQKVPKGFARSNGRIEATEVDIATKLAGRISNELVDEGDFVTAGQVLAHGR
jgi:multidrug efflux pump subunit AcrA (membrane-fusion protein)